MTRLNFSLTSSGVVDLISSEEIVEGRRFAFIVCPFQGHGLEIGKLPIERLLASLVADLFMNRPSEHANCGVNDLFPSTRNKFATSQFSSPKKQKPQIQTAR